VAVATIWQISTPQVASKGFSQAGGDSDAFKPTSASVPGLVPSANCLHRRYGGALQRRLRGGRRLQTTEMTTVVNRDRPARWGDGDDKTNHRDLTPSAPSPATTPSHCI